MTDDAYACGRKLALKMVREYISTDHHNLTEKTYYDEKPVLQYFSKEARKRYTNRRFLNWFVIDASGAYDTAFRFAVQSGLGAFTAKELQAGEGNE
jgi:hypothetical protein